MARLSTVRTPPIALRASHRSEEMAPLTASASVIEPVLLHRCRFGKGSMTGTPLPWSDASPAVAVASSARVAPAQNCVGSVSLQAWFQRSAPCMAVSWRSASPTWRSRWAFQRQPSRAADCNKRAGRN